MLQTMFQRTLIFIRDWISKMIKSSDVRTAFNIDVALSSAMATAMQDWAAIYKNEPDWKSETVIPLNLGATIASEIAGNVTLEMALKITGSKRADFLALQMEKVVESTPTQLEFGLSKGGLIFKPFVSGKNIHVDFVHADQFYPVSFDNDGNLIGCVFTDQKKIGAVWFTRLEFHQLLDGGFYEVRNAAFRSTTQDDLGNATDLAAVPAWQDLKPYARISNINQPMFGYYRVPLANNIDPTSPLGVSCYSRAVDLIEQADKQWSRIVWEYESGERAVYIDELAFGVDDNGKPLLPNKRLYRRLQGTGTIGSNNKLFDDYSPQMRDENLWVGLDKILKRIESNCGLAFGTLITDPSNVEKTATEIKASKQRTFRTITGNQKALKTALNGLLYAMDAWATIYKLAPAGKFQTHYEFDDSIVNDKDTQFMQDMQSLGQKTLSRVEFRMRTYGEDETTAKKRIQEIDDESKTAFDLFNNPTQVDESETA